MCKKPDNTNIISFTHSVFSSTLITQKCEKQDWANTYTKTRYAQKSFCKYFDIMSWFGCHNHKTKARKLSQKTSHVELDWLPHFESPQLQIMKASLASAKTGAHI